MKAIKWVLWTASVGTAADLAIFVLAVEEVLPAIWGMGALLAIPFLCALFYIGVVGNGSPNDEHPNVYETIGMGGGGGC